MLHYLLLASLAWMLVEAVEMYRALVTVFAKYAQCYMLKRCLIGWGEFESNDDVAELHVLGCRLTY